MLKLNMMIALLCSMPPSSQRQTATYCRALGRHSGPEMSSGWIRPPGSQR